MATAGCPPQRHQRYVDTVELWDPRGSVDIVDWRRADLVSERLLYQRSAFTSVLAEINRRRAGAPHKAPAAPRWLPLRLDAAAAGWPWGLVIDDGLVLPTRTAARWVEGGAALPQHERVGTWWRICCPADHNWTSYVAAGTLEVAVRRALHGAAPIDTAVRVIRSQIRHDLLIAVVDATPPHRPSIRLVAQDLGGRAGPNSRWGCTPAADLNAANNLCY